MSLFEKNLLLNACLMPVLRQVTKLIPASEFQTLAFQMFQFGKC
jgi:hypothetical protein